MDAASVAALTTALAGLIAALAQWSWLIGPRRNGHRARIHTIEDRLASSEAALATCLRRLRARRRRQRRRRGRRRGGSPHRQPRERAPHERTVE